MLGVLGPFAHQRSRTPQHAASWHPAVALAVADLFDVLAVYYETSTPGALVLNDGAALAVARAYLGEQA